MSTQTKRIQNKISPKEKVEKVKSDLKPKQSRDLLLLLLMGMTIFIMILGHENIDTMGFSMYGTMLVSMMLMYINRHMDMSEAAHKALTILVLIGVAAIIGLMAANIYFQFSDWSLGSCELSKQI